jgi:HK97 family phage prohead protease
MATIEGYVSVFGEFSDPIPEGDGRPFFEKMCPGAFSRVLAQGSDVSINLEHKSEQVFGRRGDGSLCLVEDETGLFFQCVIPNSPLGLLVLNGVRSGLYRGGSIKMLIGDSRLVTGYDRPIREVVEVGRLVHVTLTHSPAYRGTWVRVTG